MSEVNKLVHLNAPPKSHTYCMLNERHQLYLYPNRKHPTYRAERSARVADARIRDILAHRAPTRRRASEVGRYFVPQSM